MANFTPIATGGGNAATVNSPLYELDAALTTLQANGGGNAAPVGYYRFAYYAANL